MDEKYLNDPIVSLMKSMGFSDEYIMANVKIEKSENGASAGDHKSETKEEKDINKLGKEAVKDEEKVKEDVKNEEKVKEDEKNTAEDKNAEDKKEEKSDKEDIMKSLGSVFAPLMENFQKSIDKFQETVDGINDKLDKMSGVPPMFRSEGLNNMTAIQKSFEERKDEAGKYEVNVVKDRPMAVKLIEKSLEEAPESIAKSLESDALAYLINPDAETVGENLARYMYEKNGVKFVK